MSKIELSRNSLMELNKVYFWTATINNWNLLLKHDEYKKIIVESLSNLSNRKLISIYGFVIMPNHIHLLWELNELNDIEKPNASFLKFTAHKFKQLLFENHPRLLKDYEVKEKTRRYRFWQRDPLAVEILSREMFEQKLEYIHNNPIQEHWNLAHAPEEYYYSSAFDYCDRNSRFSFLKHYIERV